LKFDPLDRNFYKRIFSLYLFFALLILLFKNPIPKLLGLTLGLVMSLLNLRLQAKVLYRALASKNVRFARGYTLTNYFIRQFAVFMVLLVSLKSPYLNIFTTALGLIIVKLSFMLYGIYDSLLYIIRKK